MLLRELTNPVFTHIALGASHTYSHLRSPPTPNPQCPKRGQGAGGRGRAFKDPMLQRENFFCNIFLEINLKNYEKTDGSGVLVGIHMDFLVTLLLIASFDKFILYKRLKV